MSVHLTFYLPKPLFLLTNRFTYYNKFQARHQMGHLWVFPLKSVENLPKALLNSFLTFACRSLSVSLDAPLPTNTNIIIHNEIYCTTITNIHVHVGHYSNLAYFGHCIFLIFIIHNLNEVKVC